jgi:hypothetical protein
MDMHQRETLGAKEFEVIASYFARTMANSIRYVLREDGRDEVLLCFNGTPDLYAYEPIELIVTSTAIRASGDCICEDCGRTYYKHPFSGHMSWNNEPYLHRLCDGTLVKL